MTPSATPPTPAPARAVHGAAKAPAHGNDPSLWQCLQVQRRVISALLMRELLTRYGRNNIGFLWLFVEPMLFTALIVVLWAFLRRHGIDSNIPIVAFAITGYSSVLMWRSMPGRCIGAIGPNRALLFHRPVKLMDVYIARILLEFLGATTSFVVLSLGATAAGWIKLPEDVLMVVAGWFMLGWFGASLALLVGPGSEKTKIVEKVWTPISYVMFPLSGAAFVVDALPPAGREIILWLPMVHGVELVRDGYFGSLFNAHYNIAYMAVVCIVMNLIGLALVRDLERRGVTD